MSLINDALRRASQAKKDRPPEPSSGAPMQPVQPPTRPANYFAPLLIIFLIAVLLICAGWFFWKGWSAKSPEKIVNQSAKPTPSPVETQKNSPAVAAPAPPVVVPVQGTVPTNPVSTTAPVVAVTNVVAAVEVAPPPPQPPALKLQGIFYRTTNPSALVNGNTVLVGDKVLGARVTKIEKQEVTLEWNGQKILLTMP